MINSIKEYVNDHYPSKRTMIAGAICAAAAIEMAILIPYNISQIHHVADRALMIAKYNLSASLGGAIFYGLCGLNIIPRTAAIGAAIFSMYSVCTFQQENAYLTSRAIGNTVKFICTEILAPISDHILAPVLRKIRDVAAVLLDLIGRLIVNMSLPKHPIWIGVLVLVGAIAIYKLVIPRFTTGTTAVATP